MKTANTLAWFSIGAGLMYFLDPALGRRRRAIARDKTISLSRGLAHAADDLRQDVRNRARGLAAETRAALHYQPVPPGQLVERVRSRLGRVVSHPAAIDVRADAEGTVMLSGAIFQDEIPGLLRAVQGVPSVRRIENHLEPHSPETTHPALLGGPRRLPAQLDILQSHWSPTTRLLSGVTGAYVTAEGTRHTGIIGLLLKLTGIALLIRTLTNLDLPHLLGLGVGRRAVTLHKSIRINMPVGEVFGFFANYDNFPLWMHNVRRVIDRGDGTSHWIVAGPLGIPTHFNACLTEYIPNQCIGWTTAPRSLIAHTGIIRFVEGADNATRVDVEMSYNPLVGALGHAIASLLGADPRHEMDQDLLRTKTLIERARFPHDAAKHLVSTAT
jgi:uncharacterized membrane protein